MEIKQSLRLPRRIADNLKVLIKIVETVHKSTDLKEIYDKALDLVVELEKVDMAAIYLVDELSNEAVLQAHRNFPQDYVDSAARIPYPKGITWRVISSGQILNIDDIHKEPDIGGAGRRAGFHGVLGVPVLFEGKAIGVIWFARYEQEKFTRKEVELLGTIGNQIAIAIAWAKQKQELEERNENLSILSGITEKVHGSSGLKLTYETFLDMTRDIKVFDIMALYLVEGSGDGREAVIQIHRNLPEGYLKKARRIPYPAGVTWKVINSGEPIYHNIFDGTSPLGPAGRALGRRSVLSIPLKHQTRTIGVVHFMSAENKAYGKQEVDFLFSLGNHIGTAIAEAKMFEEARERASELEELYENLKSAQDQLIQTEKLASLGQLVSSIAHEINNPLTPILGYSQMLLSHEEADPEKAQRYLEVIYQSADKVRKIVENLLSFARKDKPRREYADINNIIEKAVEFREYQLSLENVRVTMDLDPELPETMVDSNQMQQVFTNIILNAYHAISSSELHDGTIGMRTRHSDGQIIITISDTGPGIPEEVLSKIFDPFFTTKPTGLGTGLGLSVSYGIIKEHDGEILVESGRGKGTTFVISIPVLDYKDYLNAHEALEEEARAAESAPRDGKRVLIVEDEELVTALITGILESDGCLVDLASNGEEALEIIDKSDYDFIVCDIKMPQMDGKEFFRLLSIKDEDLARRILFITGDPGSGTLDFIDETGNRFLTKPFKVEDFRKAVSGL